MARQVGMVLRPRAIVLGPDVVGRPDAGIGVQSGHTQGDVGQAGAVAQ